MKYMLDGYNVIGQVNHISLADANKIERFIEWLTKYRKAGDHLTVVFDGQNEYVGFNRTEKHPGVTIVHTAASESADDYIKEKMRTKDTSNITVVTSDRDILFHAKKANVRAMTSVAFLNWFCKDTPKSDVKQSPRITSHHVEQWLDEFNGGVNK